jgi:hypothetical protein
MKIFLHRKYISFLISVLAVPALVFAANPSPAPTPIVAVDSANASNLLNRMQVEAYKVDNEADTLLAYDRSDLNWLADASEISRMAYRVNKMDRSLYQLRNMQNEVAAPQSKLISRIAPDVILLTDELNVSIHFLNHNQDGLWRPQWHDYLSDMYHVSAHIQKDMKNLKELEEASLNPAQATGSVASS